MCNGAQSWRGSREVIGACIQISFHYRDWEGRGGIRMCSITPTWLTHCTAGKKSTATQQLKNQRTASWSRPCSTTSVMVTVTPRCYLCSCSTVEGQGECWWKHRLKSVPYQGFSGAVTMVTSFHLLPFPTSLLLDTLFFIGLTLFTAAFNHPIASAGYITTANIIKTWLTVKVDGEEQRWNTKCSSWVLCHSERHIFWKPGNILAPR